MTIPAVPIRTRTRAFPVRGWSMRPVTGMLLLDIQAALPGTGDPEPRRSVRFALTEAQVRQLAEQLTSELAMLRKERPAGTA